MLGGDGRDRDGEVVVDAEPGRPVAVRMVEATREVECARAHTRDHVPQRSRRAPGRQGGGFVHVSEGGRVARADAEPARPAAGIGRGPLHRGDVAGVVCEEQLGVGRRIRLHHGRAAFTDESPLPRELERKGEALRLERVRRAQPVLLHLR